MSLDFILLLVILIVLTQLILLQLKQKHKFLDVPLLSGVFVYHFIFYLAYFAYTVFNPSDSRRYYAIAEGFNYEMWIDHFEAGTDFIKFLAFPFIEMGFSYLALMLLFSWFGYLGFVFTYIFFRENIPVKISVFGGFDLLSLLLFLPNMHFWSASLGKGSIIFMALMLFVYGIKDPKTRVFPLILGGFLTFMVRPHVFAFALVAALFGLLFSKNDKISGSTKFAIVIIGIGVMIAGSSQILGMANLNQSDNVVEDFSSFTGDRASSLSNSGSGVDMQNYPLVFKFFTFWFRPLFVDAPNILGFGSSVENLIYLLLFIKIINKRFWKFLKKAPYVVKMSTLMFLLTSFAMTFVMSNLGIIMRQKQMVMYFMFFVIYYFLAEERVIEYKDRQRRKIKRQELISANEAG